MDVYLIGHGASWEGFGSAFLCYDAWVDIIPYVYGMIVLDKLFIPADITSDVYDHSTLRSSVVGSCYGFGFRNAFLHPGGMTAHSRSFAGPTGLALVTECIFNYMNIYAYYWNIIGDSSYESHLQGLASSNQGDYSDFEYEDSGTAVWC